MKIAYLDCFAGISGDMLLGALVGAGVPLEVMDRAVGSLGLGTSLRVETVDRSGISSNKVHVMENGRLADGGLPDEKPHTHAHSHEEPHSHAQAHAHDHGHEHPHSHGDEHTHAHARSGHSHETHWHSQGDARQGEAQEAAAHTHAEPHVHAPGKPHVHGRSLFAIRELLLGSDLAEGIQRRAVDAFELLGRSEAKIHNVPVEQIHFHEVGAVDAIADIVGACAGLEYLGDVQWFCSPVNVGGGMVECAHGTFPVPAPATADLLRGVPTYSAHMQKELVTPTGAALLAMLRPDWGPQPAMRVGSIGYGAGSRNPKGFPNVLRLLVGESFDAQMSEDGFEPVTVLETAVDDASPQLLAFTAAKALEAGALDAMLTPVVMKKGRPGTLITLLCKPTQAGALEELLLRETTTLGVRRREERRSCLAREHLAVETGYGTVRVKTGLRFGEVLNAAPEFEDCRRAADEHGIPVKQVQQAAIAAYANRVAAEATTASK